MKRLLFLLLLLGRMGPCVTGTERMDLSGLWRFQLDPMGFGKTPGSELYLKKLSGTIYLPAGKNAFRPGFFIRVSVSSGGNAIW